MEARKIYFLIIFFFLFISIFVLNVNILKNCPEQTEKFNNVCVKTCISEEGIVNSENIKKFKGCVVVKGSLRILQETFDGKNNISGLNIENLEIFSSVKKITGFLEVKAKHESFTNLSSFRNLEIIAGNELWHENKEIYTYDIWYHLLARNIIEKHYAASHFVQNTSLKFLGLKSLKMLRSGGIIIKDNSNLCYAYENDWKKFNQLIISKERYAWLQFNKNLTNCQAENEVCAKECTLTGCWGKKIDQCILSNYKDISESNFCVTNTILIFLLAILFIFVLFLIYVIFKSEQNYLKSLNIQNLWTNNDDKKSIIKNQNVKMSRDENIEIWVA
ncbi:hypothetical protein PVAND_006313 [Polypedilum vanderplanki]|uniref:Receptor L-domain domain-containing protein n=1 Tax=Polypedilum vanderplanki TaxID=319348 RepID=A0A9J6C393_POLVA|nr:hypothetical protein PVAND_006313 [Polypedilum vanderplanki]